MTRITPALALLACLFALPALAQDAAPHDATVCEILAKPSAFNGQIVKLQGEVVAGFDTFQIIDKSCKQDVNAIWLDYPEGTHGKAGPLEFVNLQPASNAPFSLPAITGPAVSLDKNKDWADFDKLLSTPVKTQALCLGCMANTVTATLVGRIDGTDTAGLQRDAQGKPSGLSGFGNLRQYRARLVLQSVSGVQAHPIDYSQVAELGAAPKVPGVPDSANPASGGGRRGGGGGGGVVASSPGFGVDLAAPARFQARGFTPGTAIADDLNRAGNAFGKPGEGNGVEAANGITNEAKKNESPKGSGKSPDNVLYLCTLDQERLKNEALTIAITHAGAEVADLRASTTLPTFALLEFHAWQTTLYSVIANHLRAASLPGGFLLWDVTWPPSDLSTKASSSLRAYMYSVAFAEQK